VTARTSCHSFFGGCHVNERKCLARNRAARVAYVQRTRIPQRWNILKLADDFEGVVTLKDKATAPCCKSDDRQRSARFQALETWRKSANDDLATAVWRGNSDVYVLMLGSSLHPALHSYFQECRAGQPHAGGLRHVQERFPTVGHRARGRTARWSPYLAKSRRRGAR